MKLKLTSNQLKKKLQMQQKTHILIHTWKRGSNVTHLELD